MGEETPSAVGRISRLTRHSIVAPIWNHLSAIRSVSLEGNCLRIEGHRSRAIPLLELRGPIEVRNGLFWPTLVAPGGGETIRFSGVPAAAAIEFSKKVNDARVAAARSAFDEVRPRLALLSEVGDRLSNPKRYPAARGVAGFVEEARAILAWLPQFLPTDVVDSETIEYVARVSHLVANAGLLRKRACARFVEAELEAVQKFLDTVERNSLTPEQRLAVVTDENATLVLAGAGSGKTAVIAAKAAYLATRGIRKPSELLLLAYNKPAVREMETRLREAGVEGATVKTFHALGYQIIREAEGAMPTLAPFAGDFAQTVKLAQNIIVETVARHPVAGTSLIRWFSELQFATWTAWDFETMEDYEAHVRRFKLRTLQGEIVKSVEELMIANWLYENGIQYVYERVYPELSPDQQQRRPYQPDFWLPEAGVYVEHFGVRKRRNEHGRIELVTAPGIDREIYLEGMEWKRGIHAKCGTTLIETSSQDRSDGLLLERLEKRLAPFISPNPRPAGELLERVNELGQFPHLAKLVATFLAHFKNSQMSLAECRKRAGNSGEQADRNNAFLDVFEAFEEEYRRRLATEGHIDFEDMISRAVRHIESGAYKMPFGHVLVDEFQDISSGRARLLKRLLESREDSRLFAVGDDWQSIYRFAGSDVSVMSGFQDMFGTEFLGENVRAEIDLGRTFRSCREIAEAARTFVMRNPAQIRKRTNAPRKAAPGAPPLAPLLAPDGAPPPKLRDALGRLDGIVRPGESASILLLGRYNGDKPDPTTFRELQSAFPRFNIKFSTVHSAKGLEADHVVILNASDGAFPSGKADDPVLNLAMPEPETFPHAEERRLFYVALTRARHTVTFMFDSKKPSPFLREILGQTEKLEPLRCPNCGCHAQRRKSGQFRAFVKCVGHDGCGSWFPACESCGENVPRRDDQPAQLGRRQHRSAKCACGATRPACPSCRSGWLVERNGKFGKFLGCVNYPDCRGTSRTRPTRRKPRISSGRYRTGRGIWR